MNESLTLDDSSVTGLCVSVGKRSAVVTCTVLLCDV